MEKFYARKSTKTELKFGMVTTDELGDLAIGKIGKEVKYEVTLMWKRKDDNLY